MPNLILSRHTGETIVFNEEITVTILDCQGSTVRVSIEAPRSVNIRRGELPVKGEECRHD
jgi:carbon storage regulator